jgi:hypothetical protein
MESLVSHQTLQNTPINLINWSVIDVGWGLQIIGDAVIADPNKEKVIQTPPIRNIVGRTVYTSKQQYYLLHPASHQPDLVELGPSWWK